MDFDGKKADRVTLTFWAISCVQKISKSINFMYIELLCTTDEARLII